MDDKIKCEIHINIEDSQACCGCGACSNICPKDAISMTANREGFLYPHVHEALCINCGFCKKVCCFDESWGGQISAVEYSSPFVYGVKHNDEVVRAKSRSGGIFSALSDFVMNQNGVVYGVALNDDFCAVHARAETMEERNRFRGSKYIQSDMRDVYRRMKEDLKLGRYVLFSGTSCQVASVKKYLEGVDCINLYCVDIVCHGVPSPKVWRSYLDYLEKKYKGKIDSIDFRNKSKYGWAAHFESITINGVEHDSNLFTRLFYSHNILRPSCYICPYKNTIHPGDITIADYWGIDKAIPGFNDNKGVSLVMINNHKGQLLFGNVSDEIIAQPALLENSMQNSFISPYSRPEKRDFFWKIFDGHGITPIILYLKLEDIIVRTKNKIKSIYQ